MSLLRSARLFELSRSGSVQLLRSHSHWNKDWKPGPFPVTEEERARAADKYGIPRDKYKPVADDGYGAGDYPDLGKVSVESKDPFYPWDYPEYRMNYNETLHIDANIYGEDRYNINMRPRFSLPQMLAAFLTTMGTSIALYYWSEDACFLPVLPQQRPQPGVKHYSYP